MPTPCCKPSTFFNVEIDSYAYRREKNPWVKILEMVNLAHHYNRAPLLDNRQYKTLNTLFRGLVVHGLGHVVCEYLGRKTSHFFLSPLWSEPSEVEFAMAVPFTLWEKLKFENPSQPSIRYTRPYLRVALLSFDLTNLIFTHLEDQSLIEKCIQRTLKKFEDSMTSIAEFFFLQGESASTGLTRRQSIRASHTRIHNKYVEAWQFLFNICTDTTATIRALYALLPNPPHSTMQLSFSAYTRVGRIVAVVEGHIKTILAEQESRIYTSVSPPITSHTLSMCEDCILLPEDKWKKIIDWKNRYDQYHEETYLNDTPSFDYSPTEPNHPEDVYAARREELEEARIRQEQSQSELAETQLLCNSPEVLAQSPTIDPFIPELEPSESKTTTLSWFKPTIPPGKKREVIVISDDEDFVASSQPEDSGDITENDEEKGLNAQMLICSEMTNRLDEARAQAHALLRMNAMGPESIRTLRKRQRQK